MKFNNLLVIKECGRDKNGCVLWECKCDCGNYTILRTSILTANIQKTCGNCKKIIKENEYYRFIFLNTGESFIFDLKDLDLIEKYTWHINRGYPETNITINDKKTTKRLHQFLINTNLGEVVDHINGDTLDNRRNNLRIANYQQNAANSRKQNKKIHSSKFKGVTFVKRDNKWLARITFNGITKHKYFDTEIDAAKFYNKYALEYFGDFAKLNIIPQIENR
jgi:hypothetical protein